MKIFETKSAMNKYVDKWIKKGYYVSTRKYNMPVRGGKQYQAFKTKKIPFSKIGETLLSKVTPFPIEFVTREVYKPKKLEKML